MAKPIQLLLLKTIENLGIVGDIVKVKPGYARNYLVPHGFAEPPTKVKIEALKEERARAESELNILRKQRVELLERMMDVQLTLVRSCNDQGVLYGSVTQRDISDALIEAGYGVDTRSIRLHQPIRRIGPNEVTVQFEKELRTDIAVIIEPDQPLEEREEMEFDNEGNLIEKSSKEEARARRKERKAAREKQHEEEAEPKPVETSA